MVSVAVGTPGSEEDERLVGRQATVTVPGPIPEVSGVASSFSWNPSELPYAHDSWWRSTPQAPPGFSTWSPPPGREPGGRLGRRSGGGLHVVLFGRPDLSASRRLSRTR